MYSVTISGNQAGQRLDKFLHKYLPLAGNGFLYKMLRKKNITLNGKKAEGSELLAVNDTLRFFLSEETLAKFMGRDGQPKAAPGTGEYARAYGRLKGIRVLYEDSHIMLLNKPAGVLTQKAAPGDDSLNEWMIGYLLEKESAFASELATFHPSVANRLDRNTSGIVLCGKSLAGSQLLSLCIRERYLRKFYITICAGVLQKPETVHGYLKKDTALNQVSICAELPEGTAGDAYEPIHTAYTPLAATEDYTLLEVELITGKPHQIRAHLASLGHPVIGDFKYGRQALNRELSNTYGLKNQLLHACRIEFPKTLPPEAALTPETAGVYEALAGKIFRAPCPKQFQTLQRALIDGRTDRRTDKHC